MKKRSLELTRAIQVLLRERPPLTKIAIAKQLGVHRHTVANHIKWLDANRLYSPIQIVNHADSRLITEINEMTHRDLISFRGQEITRRYESKSELTVKKEVPSIDVRQFTPKERDEITRVIRRIARAESMGEEQS